MNSSPDPLADDGLTFLGAAKLHARRFDRSIVSSIFLLNASDRLVTDSAGGVLALTDLRPPKRRAGTLAATLVVGLALVVWAGLRGLLLPGALGGFALLVVLTVIAPKKVRSIQAARRHDAAGATWLVTDVAAEPGRRIGDRLVRRACELADESCVALVLSVAQSATSAIALYERHEFARFDCVRQRCLMHRPPAGAASIPR